MKKRYTQIFFIFSGAFLLSYTALAQSKATSGIWSQLLQVKYEYSNSQGYKPQFSENLKNLSGRQVILRGYMYPLDIGPKQKHFMLSYYPIASCFFCGGAGPESIVEVFPNVPIRTSQMPIMLQGKLELNNQDPQKMFFVLSNAKIIK